MPPVAPPVVPFCSAHVLDPLSNGDRVLHLASKTVLRQIQPHCELGTFQVFWLGLTARSTRTQPAPAVSSNNFPAFFAPAKIMSPAGPVNFFR